MNENRGSWYLVTAMILGLSIGLLTAWVLWPAQITSFSPAALTEPEKDVYRLLIASAYNANGNLERAEARLALLRDPSSTQALIAQAQRHLEAGRPEAEVKALLSLAQALQVESTRP